MQYYLGVDIGTTATKAVASTPHGEVIAIETIYYPMQHPQLGWSEQDPNEILQAVIQGMNKIVAALTPKTPTFISFSAAMHSLMAVDGEGKALTSLLIWADNRAAKVASDLRKMERGTQFYQQTGVPIHSMSPLCKLLWWKQQEPDLLARAYKFIGIKEYIFFKLFGQFIVDTSIASATGLLHIESLDWHKEILSFIGIRKDQLSDIVSPKHILYNNRHTSSLVIPLQTPIVIGGSDGALSNLATTANGNNPLVVTIGTSGAVRIMVNHPQTDIHMRTFCYHVKDGAYIIGGATNNGAVVVQWLKETLLETEESYEELLAQAEQIKPGSDGLVFLPYLLGERAPIWNEQAKGVFFGLGVQHGKAHLIRACLEGIVYGIYSIGKVLLEKGEVEVLYATGGFARNELGLQLLADVFNKTLLVSSAIESSALGAVVLGAEALELSFTREHHPTTTYHPNAHNHQVYQKAFAKFQRLYECLKGEM